MEEDGERIREMKMQEAERQRERLYQIYGPKSEEIRNAYEVHLPEPFLTLMFILFVLVFPSFTSLNFM